MSGPPDFVYPYTATPLRSKPAYGAEALIYAKGGKAEEVCQSATDTLCDKCGLYNRGVKVRTDIGILRRTKAPAVLIELAFMSNPSEAVRLASNTQAAFIGYSYAGLIDALRLNVAGTETAYPY